MKPKEQYKRMFIEDDLINNQQPEVTGVQGGEVGATIKKNETHDPSFSSPADIKKITEKTLSKEQIEFNLGSAYQEGFQKSQEMMKKMIEKECEKVDAVEVDIGEYDKFISAHNLKELLSKIGGKE